MVIRDEDRQRLFARFQRKEQEYSISTLPKKKVDLERKIFGIVPSMWAGQWQKLKSSLYLLNSVRHSYDMGGKIPLVLCTHRK